MTNEEKELLLGDLCARLPHTDTVDDTFDCVDRLNTRHFDCRDLIDIGSIGKQGEKELLLKDLAARLPYGVK